MLVNVIDRDGNRMRSSLNRIIIPLQVDDIAPVDRLFLTRRIEGAICAHIRNDEFLQRLVRAKGRTASQEVSSDHVADILKELVYAPVLDRIEIQEIRRNGQKATRRNGMIPMNEDTVKEWRRYAAQFRQEVQSYAKERIESLLSESRHENKKPTI